VTRLRCNAPGKVNLCLFIGRPRANGYHPLVSLVQPVSLADELELTPAGGDADEVICPGVEGENLAARALAAFRAETGWDGAPVRIEIAKRVPVAAGMGGGSADAAATLRLAAAAAARQAGTAPHGPGGADDPELTGPAHADLPRDRAAEGAGPSAADLRRIAIGLGADVPSQLAPERCLMTGIGEGVRRLGDPAPCGLLIVPSAHALSTAEVYAEFDRLGLGRDPDELDRLSGQVPGAARAGSLLAERLLHNDLEAPARSLCPPIGDALADVRAAGAVRAMVSGSGPTVFGLFPGEEGIAHARAAAEALRARHPEAVAAVPVGRTFAEPRAH
jgi:4-diphosphocytidyl-2-C-methyl-D-erythritol kinase